MKHVTEFAAHAPAIDDQHRQAIIWLWAQLIELHGATWEKVHTLEVDPAGIWARGMTGMGRSHIEQAFDLWLKGDHQWPPQTPGQLRGPWEAWRKDNMRPSFPAAPALPAPAKTPYALAYGATAAMYAVRCCGGAFPIKPRERDPSIAVDCRAIAYGVPLIDWDETDGAERAYEHLRTEFNRAWLAATT